jgi:hypothetical protein
VSSFAPGTVKAGARREALAVQSFRIRPFRGLVMERTRKSNSPQPNQMLATIVRQFEPSRLEGQTLMRIFELVYSPTEHGTKSRSLNEGVAVEQAARRDSMARTGRRGGER